MLFRLLHITVVNAHVLYSETREAGQRVMPQKDFIVSIITSLVGEGAVASLKVIARAVQRVAQGKDLDQVNHHLITRIPQPEQQPERRLCTDKDCAQCSTPASCHRSQYYCPGCPGQPGLHPGCFADRF